jgi:DNA-nicking Smr family endonuclease
MKKNRKASVSADDISLFRASMTDVTPLGRAQKFEHERLPPRPIPTQRLLDDRETLRDSLSDHLPWDRATQTGDELTYARDGIGMQTLRKLRRGHWITQAELDLHGQTVAEARELLVEFLNLCVRRGLRCVRIIHGKGLRSKNREPVLKQKVGRWLMQRDEILAFCQAQRADGGSGAMMVLLKGTSKKAER